MKKKHFSKLSIILALLLLLSGCGGAMSSDSENFSNADKSEAWVDEGWDSGNMESEKPELDNSPTEISENLSENDLANRKLIKTLYLTMETKEFDRLKSMFGELIPAYGGYIQESNFYDPQREGRYRSYNLTVRIPVNNLDAFRDKVGLLGTITNESEKLDDVTTTYVDLQAYKEALDIEYDKILELLEKATELDHILVLESKLSELRYEINSYESKLRTYDNLIAYSTVHININEVSIETVTDDSITSRITTGFMQSLYSVRDFFVDLIVGILSNLPVIFVIAVALFMFMMIRRRFKKCTPKTRKGFFKSKKQKSNSIDESLDT